MSANTTMNRPCLKCLKEEGHGDGLKLFLLTPFFNRSLHICGRRWGVEIFQRKIDISMNFEKLYCNSASFEIYMLFDLILLLMILAGWWAKPFKKWRGKFLKLQAPMFLPVFYRWFVCFISQCFQNLNLWFLAVACIYVYFSSQTCVKYCSKAERDAKKKKVEGDAKKRKAEKDAVFEELKPHFLTLARSAYGVHLVKKMLDNGMFKLGNDRIEVYSCCSYWIFIF